jgi:hypothetical protein
MEKTNFQFKILCQNLPVGNEETHKKETALRTVGVPAEI